MTAQVLVTISALMFSLLIAALALKGDAVIWRFPPYQRFKSLVRDIEQLSITRVKGANPATPVTIRMMGRRRVPEIFALENGRADGITIVDCFGAIYLKDESIDDALTVIQVNAWITIIVSLIGLIFIFASDSHDKDLIFDSGVWAVVPRTMELLLSHHFVLVAELVVIATSIIYLFHIARLLSKINRVFNLTGE